jgi:hypothetical protein
MRNYGKAAKPPPAIAGRTTPVQTGPAGVKGEIMVFIKAHRKQLILAVSLAVTALTVAACGGGGPAAVAQGAAPGQWTKAEVSQFTAAGGGSGGDSQDSCIIGYFERDMSFANAMAVVSVDPASGAGMSAAQVKAALVSKYGTTQGDATSAQFEQTVTDSDTNCTGSAASPTAAAAAPAPTADPAATSESSCTVDCVDPVASGESGWLAQVQGALQNVQQDLTTISSDASSNPDNLALDGSELAQDAQAVLNDEIDPAPVDNSDFVAAMNDYIAAGNDYSGDSSSGQQNPAQANQEIGEGNTALSSFDTANGGSSAAAAPSTSAPASSTPVASGTATATVLWCGPVINIRTAPSLAVWETGSDGADDVYVNVIPQFKAGAMAIDNPGTPAATVVADSGSLCSAVVEADEEPPPADLAQYNMAMAYFLKASQVLHTGASAYAASLATARVEVNSGLSELNTFLTAIGK